MRAEIGIYNFDLNEDIPSLTITVNPRCDTFPRLTHFCYLEGFQELKYLRQLMNNFLYEPEP
jgi:hypothetical protein